VTVVDASLYRFVNRLADRTSFAHPLFVAYAKYGVALFGLLLLVAWWQARRTDNRCSLAAVVWGGAGTLAALGAGQIVGHVVDRARPYTAMPTAHLLITRTSDFSVPSDHATAVGAVAAGLWLANRRFGSMAGVLALLMAFSRVYVGAHYPGDVIAGLVLGAGIVLVLWPLAGRVLRPSLRRLEPSPLAFLVTGMNMRSA